MPSEDQYIRPRNWAKFQPVREKNAKYIRNYPALLDDEDYLSLAISERLVLHGIWMLCGTLGRPLPQSSSFLGRRLGVPSQVVGRALKALSDCNWLETCTKNCKLRHETVAPRVERREKREERREKEVLRTSKKPPAKRASVPDGFEEWWAEYPLKKGKQAAVRAYARALKMAKPDKLLAGLRAFVRAEPWRGDLSFCPHASTWLNRGSWEDEHLANGEDGGPRPPEHLSQDEKMDWWEEYLKGQPDGNEQPTS